MELLTPLHTTHINLLTLWILAGVLAIAWALSLAAVAILVWHVAGASSSTTTTHVAHGAGSPPIRSVLTTERILVALDAAGFTDLRRNNADTIFALLPEHSGYMAITPDAHGWTVTMVTGPQTGDDGDAWSAGHVTTMVGLNASLSAARRELAGAA